MSTSDAGLVFDVQRFSIHDGPGIRTVIFFKGCALACVWCQNPEAMLPTPELAYYEDRCLHGCRECLDVCPEDAIRDQRTSRVDFDRCTVCGKCVEVCPADALVQVGRTMTPQDLLREVERDRSFYDATGGGITLSGGEPVLHSVFLRSFLPLARAAGLHVAIETAGAYPFDLLEPLLPDLDLILFDLKVMDPTLHQHYTTKDNEQAHENLRRLLERGAPVWARMPIIPGMNTDADNLEATAAFLHRLGIADLTLLPYNHLWEAKLPRLSTERRPLGIKPPEPSLYAGVREELERHGITAHL